MTHEPSAIDRIQDTLGNAALASRFLPRSRRERLEDSMTAQPHEPAAVRPQPTIRSVRASLPEEQRPLFQAEIERTPLDQIPEVVAVWELRARAFATPGIAQAAGEATAYLQGHGELELLTEGEVRQQHPRLRP
jgi:hypothetical protein